MKYDKGKSVKECIHSIPDIKVMQLHEYFEVTPQTTDWNTIEILFPEMPENVRSALSDFKSLIRKSRLTRNQLKKGFININALISIQNPVFSSDFFDSSLIDVNFEKLKKLKSRKPLLTQIPFECLEFMRLFSAKANRQIKNFNQVQWAIDMHFKLEDLNCFKTLLTSLAHFYESKEIDQGLKVIDRNHQLLYSKLQDARLCEHTEKDLQYTCSESIITDVLFSLLKAIKPSWKPNEENGSDALKKIIQNHGPVLVCLARGRLDASRKYSHAREKNLSLKCNQAFEDLQLDGIDKDQCHDFVIVSGFYEHKRDQDTQLMIIVNRIAFQSEQESEIKSGIVSYDHLCQMMVPLSEDCQVQYLIANEHVKKIYTDMLIKQEYGEKLVASLHQFIKENIFDNHRGLFDQCVEIYKKTKRSLWTCTEHLFRINVAVSLDQLGIMPTHSNEWRIVKSVKIPHRQMYHVYLALDNKRIFKKS